MPIRAVPPQLPSTAHCLAMTVGGAFRGAACWACRMIKDHKMQLHDLTELEWRLIRELIPMSGATEEPRLATVRACVNGILWRMRTGEPWSQVPREYGNHKSIYCNFARWRQSGAWQNVTRMLAQIRAGKVPHPSD
jgi:transposase